MRTAGDDLGQFAGNSGVQTELSGVEQGIHDRALEVLGSIAFCRRVSATRVGLADNLTHVQATPRRAISN